MAIDSRAGVVAYSVVPSGQGFLIAAPGMAATVLMTEVAVVTT